MIFDRDIDLRHVLKYWIPFEIICIISLLFYIAVKERGRNRNVEQKLNKALLEKIKDVDDKIENAEHSRSFFGEEMYKKLIEIDASRSEALVFDRGK